MRTATLYPIVIMAIITSTFSQQASAQDYSFYNNMFSNMLSNKIWDNIYAQSSPGYTEAKRKLVDPRSQAPAAPVTPDLMNRAVRFKSSGTRLMTQKFADGLSDTFKLDKAGMKEMVTSFLDRYDSEAAAKGYSNDLALALVSYIGLNSRVYRGSTGTPRYPFDQDPELRDAIAEYAAQNGTFNKMSDRLKQETYEALVMVGVFTQIIYEQARKNNNLQALREVKQMAEKNLKSIGVRP